MVTDNAAYIGELCLDDVNFVIFMDNFSSFRNIQLVWRLLYQYRRYIVSCCVACAFFNTRMTLIKDTTFYYLLGVGLIVNGTGQTTLQSQLKEVFDRDWNSAYSHPLDTISVY